MNIYLPIAEVSVNAFLLLGLGGGVGFLSGLFGVGGGFLMTPLLIMIGILDWDNPGGNMPLIFGMTLVLEIVAATAIAIILHATGLEGWQGGLHLGLILGFGIVTPAVAINNLYQRKPFALTAIDSGHLTLGLILAGVIIGLFG